MMKSLKKITSSETPYTEYSIEILKQLKQMGR